MVKTDLQIYDNFLDDDSFRKLHKWMLVVEDGPTNEKAFNCKWVYTSSIDYPFADPRNTSLENNFMFTHMFYANHGFFLSEGIDYISPIMDKINPYAVYRIKANMMVRSDKIIKNSFHIDHNLDDINLDQRKDFLKHFYTAIYYVNSNNGYTFFEDTDQIVQSKANRLVVFPSIWQHNGTNCTDENVRVLININFVKRMNGPY